MAVFAFCAVLAGRQVKQCARRRFICLRFLVTSGASVTVRATHVWKVAVVGDVSYEKMMATMDIRY